MAKKSFNALYGKVSIPTVYCSHCSHTSFVVKGQFTCCGRRCADMPTTDKRITIVANQKLGTPNKREQQARQETLIAQDFCCLFCECRFKQRVYHQSHPIHLQLRWLTDTPVIHRRQQHLIAACHVCAKLTRYAEFQTIEEAKTYVITHWKEHQYSTHLHLQVLPTGVSAQSQESRILPAEMQKQSQLTIVPKLITQADHYGSRSCSDAGDENLDGAQADSGKAAAPHRDLESDWVVAARDREPDRNNALERFRRQYKFSNTTLAQLGGWQIKPCLVEQLCFDHNIWVEEKKINLLCQGIATFLKKKVVAWNFNREIVPIVTYLRSFVRE